MSRLIVFRVRGVGWTALTVESPENRPRPDVGLSHGHARELRDVVRAQQSLFTAQVTFRGLYGYVAQTEMESAMAPRGLHGQ